MDLRLVKSTMSAAAGWIIIIALTIVATPPAHAAASGFQRMVLAPGCYVLAPGKDDDIVAYCLDQTLPAPASGSILSNAPASYGNAVVKVDGKSPMTLQDALARHLLQIEGLGDHLRVRIRSLAPNELEICINAPTIVMGNGQYYTGDLAQMYDQIVRVIGPPGGDVGKDAANDEAAELESRVKLQQKLWNAVRQYDENAAKAADQEIYDELSRRIFFDMPDHPDAAGAPRAAPNRSKCVGQSDSVEVCIDR